MHKHRMQPADLFIIGVSTHDSWVHNAVQKHGKWVHRKGPVPGMLLDTVADLLVG